jgi:hypothetical protein
MTPVGMDPTTKTATMNNEMIIARHHSPRHGRHPLAFAHRAGADAGGGDSRILIKKIS